MLVALHPVPAVDVRLEQAFATAQGGSVSVGRVEGNTVSPMRLNNAAPEDRRLQDKLVNMVSRWHAELDVVAGQLQLVDLRAVNGTYVNDQQIEPGSRRVLQENDVVSFGGPSTINIRGQPLPNPWVWRVRKLHEFLAAYAPPSQGCLPAPQAAALAGFAAANSGAEREMYRFSPAAPTAHQHSAAEAAAGPARLVSPGGSGGSGSGDNGSGQRHGEVIVSPQLVPASGGAGRHPGNLLMQPPPVAADEPPAAAPAEQLQDDSSESAELAALAAYEARVAPQQASALPTATMPPGALVAHDPTQALGSGMPIVAGQLAQGGNVTTGTGAVQMPAPVEAPTAAARVPPFLARSRQALAPPHLGSLPAQEGRASPAAQPEVVDLTLDSPVSLQQQHGRGGGPEYVDLLAASVSSPTKRRHGMAQQEEQGAKRAKPSPDAHLQSASSGAGSNGATAAAAASGGAGAAGPSNDVSDKLQQEIMCPICQELLVVAHAMVPCGHWFCGECLAGWLGNGRKDCPSCRKKSTAAPVRQHAMDNMTELLAKALPAEDQEARQEKMQSWEDKKEQLAPQLTAPWRNSDGRGGRLGDGSGLLSAIAASIMGGGGGLGFGAAPLTLLDPLGGGGGGHAFGMEVPPWGGGGTRGRRTPAIVPRHAPAAAALPLAHEFRVDVSATNSTQRCSACNHGIGEFTTRIGMRPQGQGYGRRGPAQREGSWRWHHLDCLPAVYWREARVNGISNLRGIPAPEQSLVRQRLHLSSR